jgi:hypothetical protein
MDIEFCLGFVFNKKTKKANDINDINDLNGFYIYDYDIAFVNLLSPLFNNKKEPTLIKNITKIAIHETLHKAIFDITGEIANNTEEKFVDIMVLH